MVAHSHLDGDCAADSEIAEQRSAAVRHCLVPGLSGLSGGEIRTISPARSGPRTQHYRHNAAADSGVGRSVLHDCAANDRAVRAPG